MRERERESRGWMQGGDLFAAGDGGKGEGKRRKEASGAKRG